MAAAEPAKGKEAVRVVVRCRPMFGKEINEGREKIVFCNVKQASIFLQKPGGSDKDGKDFTYDAVFDETVTQAMIFEDTGLDIVESVMDGYNGTIFAYGQTGAGKSHTMAGPNNGKCDAPDQGLLPRSFIHLFSTMSGTANTQWLVRGSYLEIYNEEIRDLLSKNPKDRCELKDHPNGGVFVKDLSAFVVKSAEEMQEVFVAGINNRSVGATNMNAESSRSHSIFTVTVEACEIGADGDNHIRAGKLNMVDLAGSERQSKTGATGDRLKEATKINLSLSALGNVISALVDGKSAHVPYRDSKLTRLLQDSLGGNTKTVMVANCGPADYNFDETLSTLRYAYRAKSIKNKPKINEDPKDAMIREFQEEINRLRAQLNSGGGGGDYGGEMLDGGVEVIPSAPVVQKQVEYVEKIVEKVEYVEKVVNKGPTEEEMKELQAQMEGRVNEEAMKWEAKKQEVMRQRELADAEKQAALQELEKAQEEDRIQQENQQKLSLQLSAMQEKMLMGRQVMETAMQQEQELKRQQKMLRKQAKIEQKLEQEREAAKTENMELEEKCASQEEQIQKLTSKLEKLWEKVRRGQQDMADIQQEFQEEREDMMSMIRDLRQALKLKIAIMDAFVPQKAVRQTQGRAHWDADADEWVLSDYQVDMEQERPVRPPSAIGLPRPTTEYARVNRAMGDPNPRFRYDGIVLTDLDMPEQTSEDYEANPELGQRIESILIMALSNDDADNGADDGQDDRRNGAGLKRAGSSRPGTSRSRRDPYGQSHGRSDKNGAFPQARGLISRE
eukprot:gnl/MRDRNA2_/MRDRNA2_91468_c0_seq1.p1 gnl/MRDRNA2_/MRDRNA2_91468_c0~~gnl/MRDRNA2_/MRDRNA2_91468_c0_seq1.p1  ORF type:complete len:785 (+),score=223.52 gnl/MRDRNA2_/MRDRNA2_91468_c0_seq1:99-2453(+)